VGGGGGGAAEAELVKAVTVPKQDVIVIAKAARRYFILCIF
jgi:hypothetical protein